MKGEDYVGVVKARAADTARWTALGEQYTPDYETIAAVSSARWSALAGYYGTDYSAIADVSSARWSALAEVYTAEPVRGQ